jgi:isoquinoline 1-oxidoreductase subunit beta
MSATRPSTRRARRVDAVPSANALSRREFLLTTSAASAGLVIAFHLPAVLRDRAEAAAASMTPNAWLRVDATGVVTVMIARSEMGQGVRTAIPMLVAEELEADWRLVRFEQARPAAKYGDMGTGGSQSMRSLHEPLRKAGAQAREMLITAAAQAWGVDRAACRAENGAVVHDASARRQSYGALVAAAAALPVPEAPPLKPWTAHRLLGTAPARLDGPDKLAGRARYAIDAHVPGILTAVVARCPVPGGKPASFDPARAQTMPGVKRVVAISSGVAVVADSYWQARTALEAVPITWDEGALAGLTSATIAESMRTRVQTPGASFRKDGDGAAALASAARTIEAVYEAPYLAHATMEPMSCAAHVTADACIVWVGSQDPDNARKAAAQVTGLAPEKVTIELQYLGGGFGRRAEQDFVVEAVELSKAVAAPVKVVWSREDDIRHDWYRPVSTHHLRAGFDAGGAPTVWGHRMCGVGILSRLYPAAVRNGVDPTSIDVAENQPYEFPHAEMEFHLHDDGIPTGWWRSVSASQNSFAIECFMDEVAAAAGRDPLALRRELLAKHPRHRAVLELAAEKAGWGTPPPAGRARGLALVESFQSIVAHVVEASLGADGAPRVHRVTCAVDCGHVVNPDLVKGQMESAIVFGLSAALHGEITIDKGRVVQGNFDDYRVMRFSECPAIEVHLLPQGDPLGGIGEVGVPPIAPAIANAVSALIGKRVRRLPLTAENLKRA